MAHFHRRSFSIFQNPIRVLGRPQEDRESNSLKRGPVASFDYSNLILQILISTHSAAS